MKISEMRDKTSEDLRKIVADLRAELVNKRRELHAAELKNPRSVKAVRRDIAKALTVISTQSTATKKEKKNV